MDLTNPQNILDWARTVQPEGPFLSRSQLQADRFVSEALARHTRIAYRCIDAVNEEPLDETDLDA